MNHKSIIPNLLWLLSVYPQGLCASVELFYGIYSLYSHPRVNHASDVAPHQRGMNYFRGAPPKAHHYKLVPFCYSLTMTLDIGVGLLLGLFLNFVSGIDYGLSLALGIVASMFPDIDFFLPTVSAGKSPFGHREQVITFHYPLLFVPMVTIIGLIINPWVGLTFFLGSLLHFIHDSMGIGWGIKWLFPLRNKSYFFLYRVPLEAEKGLEKKRLYSWSDKELQGMKSKYHDPHFLKNIYLRPTAYGIVEHLTLLVGITAVVLSR